MKHLNYILLLVFAASSLLILNSFRKDKEPCIKGEGSAVTETRDITGVGRINLKSAAHLNISKGEKYTCTINGQKNILDNLTFQRDGDKLIISDKHCATDHLDVTITVTLPSLTMVGLEGSGDINVSGAFNVSEFEAALCGSGDIHISDAITADNLNTSVSGSGDLSIRGTFKKAETNINGSGSINISGNCDNNNISTNGSGDVHAFDFRTMNTHVNASGSGDSEVHAGNVLDVQINGSGDVLYKGDPSVTKHINGSGNVSKKG